jgi:hypothetical protein
MITQFTIALSAMVLFLPTGNTQNSCQHIRSQMSASLDSASFLSLADQYRSCIQSSRQTTIESEITAHRSRTIVFTDSNGRVRTLEQQGQRVVIDGVDLNQLSSDERAQRIAEFEAEYNEQQSVREQARNLRLRPLHLPNWDGSSTELERPRQRRLGGTIDIETNDRQGECTNQIVINGQAHQVCSGTYTFDQDGNMTTQSGL